MMESGLSASDVLALTKDNDGDGLFGGEGGGIIILILFLLLAGGGNGLFGNGNNAVRDYATQQDIVNGFNFNQLDNGIRGVERGICDLGYATLQQSNQTNLGIANLSSQMQNCCCETNRNIDAVRYENAQNTCAITNAIHADGEATRALINANVMQELRDNLQAAQLTLQNQAQTANLIQTLRPFPQPSYITCSPYTSLYGCGTTNNCGSCV